MDFGQDRYIELYIKCMFMCHRICASVEKIMQEQGTKTATEKYYYAI